MESQSGFRTATCAPTYFIRTLAACLALLLPTWTTAALASARLRPLQKNGGGIEAPPSNDLCTGAQEIPGVGPFPYLTSTVNVFEATKVGDPPAPSAQPNPAFISRSVWYTFTPAVTARYVISGCLNVGTATTLQDSVIGVYTSVAGCSGPFVERASSSVGCTQNLTAGSVVSVDLDAGTEYYVVVWSDINQPPNASFANVQLRVTSEAQPPDTCGEAVPLTLNVPMRGTNLNETNDYQLSPTTACFPTGHTPTTAPGPDVVYSFTAPSTAAYAFRLFRKTVSVDMVIYTSSVCPKPLPGTPVEVSCTAAARTGSFSGDEVCVPINAGETVYFFVDSVPLAPTFVATDYTVLVERCDTLEAEPNDTPATANPIDCGIGGAIGPLATDRDFYSIGSPAANSHLFALVDASTSGPETDFDLRVNTTTHTLEYDHRDNATGPNGGIAPNIAGTRIAGGTNTFLQVDVRQNQGGTPVEPGGPYRLYAVMQPETALVAETEPNDTLNQANSAPSNYFSGDIAPGDADFYVFQADAGDVLFVSLDGCPAKTSAGIFAQIDLLTEQGQPVEMTRSGSDQVFVIPPLNSLFAFGPNFRSGAFIMRAPYTGFYVVRVTTFPNTPAGPYALSIAKNCQVGGGGVEACNLVCQPQTLTVSTDPGQCSAVVDLPVPVGEGFCGIVTCDPASGSAFPLGTTTVTCSGVGDASCQFVVEVMDSEAPSISCPANIQVANTVASCSVPVEFAASASDNCSGADVECSPVSGSSFALGTTTVSCTATDGAGNATSCSFTVTVTDAAAPTLVCPANVTVAASAIQGCAPGASLVYTVPEAVDNCTAATVVCLPAPGTFVPAGVTTVVCTATDAAGNASSCSFTVTVSTPLSVCFMDDASGDTFTEIVDSASPLNGFWRYRKANGTTFCGTADFVQFVAGSKLVSYDRTDPVYSMECNASFNTQSTTVTVVERSTNKKHTLRDRNVLNNPPCPF